MGTLNDKSVIEFEGELRHEFFPAIERMNVKNGFYGGCDRLEIRFWFNKDTAVSTRYLTLINLLEKVAGRNTWLHYRVKSFKLDLRKRPRDTSIPEENSRGLIQFRDLNELDAPLIKKRVVGGKVMGGVMVVEAWLTSTNVEQLMNSIYL